MSELTEQIPVVGRRRLPRIPRRSRPARPLDVDGRPSVGARLFGLGSIFGKSLRDARRATLLAGLGYGFIVFVTASQLAAEFGSATARAAIATLPTQLPAIFRGMLGEPINVAALGGFLSWRSLNFVPVILGAWSITVLSGTLAIDARRGSLDLIGTTGHSRDGIAVQKASAHVVAVAVAALIVGLFIYVAGLLFATLPGDEVTLSAALSHAVWLWLMTLFPGAVAWLVAPVVGRGAAAGLGALVLVVSFVVHGYKDSIAAFGSIDTFSYFGLTAGHRPIAGVTDWGSMAALAVIELALLVGGIFVFRTRDIGITVDVGLPLPRFRLGLGGPLGRSFAERLSVAWWWGIGLGLMGFVFALNIDAFVGTLKSIPQVETMIRHLYPDADIFSAGGVLQLVFFGFGSLVVAAAAGMLANGWASDETERRLETILSTPLARRSWVARSGLGVLAAVGVLAIVIASLIGLGTVLVGADPVTPAAGSLVLGLYAGALVGIGLAVGGLVRPELAAVTAGGLGVAFYLLDSLGAALQLPSQVLDLSLTRHLGQPMAGNFDPIGLVACAVLALGGIAVAAVGYGRRDIGR